jgi:hypothetical protein
MHCPALRTRVRRAPADAPGLRWYRRLQESNPSTTFAFPTSPSISYSADSGAQMTWTSTWWVEEEAAGGFR